MTLNIQTKDDSKTLQEAETKITIKANNTEKVIPLNEAFEAIEI